jgi:hypothetical protein
MKPLTWLCPGDRSIALHAMSLGCRRVVEVAAKVSAISRQDEASFMDTHWLNMLLH